MDSRDYYRKRRRDAIVSALIMLYCAVIGFFLVAAVMIYQAITGRG